MRVEEYERHFWVKAICMQIPCMGMVENVVIMTKKEEILDLKRKDDESCFS